MDGGGGDFGFVDSVGVALVPTPRTSTTCAEWDMSNPDYKDPRALGNGMRLFETGPPQQQFNAAEYMSRGFCNVLYEPDALDDDRSI